MKLKPGVSLKGMTPQMVVAMIVVRDAYGSVDLEPTITSCNDGKHGENSLHSRDGMCRAMDVRSKPLLTSPAKHAMLAQLRSDLGEEFDVVLENEGEDNEHFHIEWDV